ncbi:MAG: sigma-54-dependent Fis family transcriptional regulator [Syntrophomonadaceae bacterium]|nr:sigma-54-dependent Fis family transcriptional regulator [Syntrophomonadaceae bacterium]
MGIITESVAARINSDWQAFVSYDKQSNLISPEIMESWRRCKMSGVNPRDGSCYNLLSPPELQNLLRERNEMIEIARPFMHKLYEFVKGSSFVVVITDERGYILELFGDADSLAKSSHYNFVQGAKWTEEEVGTNAIGTGLVLKKPFQTSGSEHYCFKHHDWTCSAAPIFDKNGRMIGILDMSGPLDGTHLHTLGMVVASAEAIMEQMLIQEKNRQLTITNNRMTNIFQNMSDGVLLIDHKGVIKDINPVAKLILGKSDRDLVGHSIQETLGQSVPAVEQTLVRQEGYTDVEILVDTVNGRVHCLSSCMPILDDNKSLSGAVILVRPIEKVQQLVNRFSGTEAHFNFEDIICHSPLMKKAVQIAARAALGNANILLEGESGTGKELFAQAIHNRSSRRKGPLVAINCGAIPRELIGSELFGYVEGAFTGAKRGGRPGKFELAGGGTLFLDEIGDMPLEQQVALLRVLQDKKISRIGDDKIIPVDFRVICATNKNLAAEVENGNFREDLFYRLNVVSINIPPLRERSEDIPLLFRHFLKVIGGDNESNARVELQPEVIHYLQQYQWPGNVRELQNVVERFISTAESPCIDVNRLQALMYQHTTNNPISNFESGNESVASERKKRKRMQSEMEYREITELLAKHNGNITLVAREMRVCRNTIYRKMRLWGIDY